MESIDELSHDCDELQSLLKSASRSNVRRLLASEITLLQKKINQLQEDSKRKEANDVSKDEKPSEKSEVAHVFTKKIESYGWDQNDKTVKIYITLTGVEKLPKENVRLEVESDSFEFKVLNLDGKNHALRINRLLEEVDPVSSSCKVKTGNVIIILKKKVPKNWAYLTNTEKKTKEEKTPKLDKDEDPSSSIMKMMKQMYDDGDDEMKRTIAKAWTESREKQTAGKSAFDM